MVLANLAPQSLNVASFGTISASFSIVLYISVTFCQFSIHLMTFEANLSQTGFFANLQLGTSDKTRWQHCHNRYDPFKTKANSDSASHGSICPFQTAIHQKSPLNIHYECYFSDDNTPQWQIFTFDVSLFYIRNNIVKAA